MNAKFRSERILLYSGGMDSFVIWRLLGHPKCLYFKIGHKYEEAEIKTILDMKDKIRETKRLDLDIQFIDLIDIGKLEFADGHIPLRNMLFATAAAVYSERVLLGALAGENSRDKSKQFFRDITDLIKFLEYPNAKVEAPFKHVTKSELLKRYLAKFKDKQDLDLLKATVSCYQAMWDETEQRYLHCGNCQACFRRWVAFENNDIEEKYYLWHPSNYLEKEWTDNKLGGLNKLMPYIKNIQLEEAWDVFINNKEAINAYKKYKDRIGEK